VVDVGTGTGAIALSIASESPGALVWATDVSPDAVALARRNVERLGVDVRVVQGDLLSPLPPELAGCFDLVVSNPPYVSAEEWDALPPDVRADPELALLGGTDVHRRLVDEAPRWLRPEGVLVVEIGAGQGDEVAALFRDGGFMDVRADPDLAGRDRVVVGRAERSS
jgi:release factor glutamine methyltransferase